VKGFLLDTNIPSEMARPSPQESVAKWPEGADDDLLYFGVVSLGEIFKGIATLPESKRRSQLQHWLTETLRPWFQDRILPVNELIAERLGPDCRTIQIEGEALESGRRPYCRNRA
jgi:predicted nucleic acid-binding protein